MVGHASHSDATDALERCLNAASPTLPLTALHVYTPRPRGMRQVAHVMMFAWPYAPSLMTLFQAMSVLRSERAADSARASQQGCTSDGGGGRGGGGGAAAAGALVVAAVRLRRGSVDSVAASEAPARHVRGRRVGLHGSQPRRARSAAAAARAPGGAGPPAAVARPVSDESPAGARGGVAPHAGAPLPRGACASARATPTLLAATPPASVMPTAVPHGTASPQAIHPSPLLDANTTGQ